MTKKSQGRLQRDAAERRENDAAQARAKAAEQLEGNSCWDDLESIRQQCAGLLGQHSSIAGILRNKDLMAFVLDIPLLTERARLLQRDLVALNEDLQSLWALHKDKTGGTDDPDVLMYCIQIYEQYNLFMERHEGTVMPTVAAILDQIQQAENRQQIAINAAAEELSERGIDPDQPVQYETAQVAENGDGTVTIDAEPVIHSV